jgi:MtN3 and saliva related transmembrane protein
MDTAIGAIAALCTTVSYVPQVKKCWSSGRADDLSLKMFLLLTAGIALWVLYGVMRGDLVIVAANSVSLYFLAIILYFKWRPRNKAAAPDSPACADC